MFLVRQRPAHRPTEVVYSVVLFGQDDPMARAPAQGDFAKLYSLAPSVGCDIILPRLLHDRATFTLRSLKLLYYLGALSGLNLYHPLPHMPSLNISSRRKL